MKNYSLPLVLFLIFMILKLCEIITWSWWWVTCPLWAIPAIIAIAVIGGGAGAGVVAVLRIIYRQVR